MARRLGRMVRLIVCNNGGFAWSRDEAGNLQLSACPPADDEGGRIERVDLATGKFERLYTQVDGHALRGPNDIVFDSTGGFWFTDLGKESERGRDKSGIDYARADGSEIREVVYDGLTFNGIGLSPDETTLYSACTLTGRLWSYPLTGPGEIARNAAGHPAAHLVARLDDAAALGQHGGDRGGQHLRRHACPGRDHDLHAPGQRKLPAAARLCGHEYLLRRSGPQDRLHDLQHVRPACLHGLAGSRVAAQFCHLRVRLT